MYHVMVEGRVRYCTTLRTNIGLFEFTKIQLTVYISVYRRYFSCILVRPLRALIATIMECIFMSIGLMSQLFENKKMIGLFVFGLSVSFSSGWTNRCL